jgi:hypothetical protein
MSDPFDVLRGSIAASPAPDVGVIKARARRIERRRRVALSSAAGVIAVVAVVGVLSKTGPGRPSQEVAQRATPAAGFAETSGSAGTAATAPASQLQAKQSLRTAANAANTAQRAPKSAGAAPAAGMAASAPSGDGSASIQTTIDVAKGPQPHSARFTLSACNGSGAEVRRSFPTSERYDFEVSRDGKRVWRWSDGRAFAQYVSDVSWAPHECKRWTETWDGTDSSGKPVATGSYQAVGVLSSSPAQRTAAKTFCLDLC